MNASKAIASRKVSRFEITLFRCEGRQLDRNDTERVTTYDRLRIRYSQYRRRERRWEDAEIWCYPGESRDLVQAIDEFSEALPPAKEEVSSSSLPQTLAVSLDPVEIRWANDEDLTDEDRAARYLDRTELDRLQYFAEHPEFADPAFGAPRKREYVWV